MRRAARRRALERRSSPRCRRSSPGPVRSISGRASRTATVQRATIEAAAQALRGGENQYAPLPGVQSLRDAVRERQRDRYGLEPEDVLVTFGATEAIAAALLALCDPVTRSWCWSRTTTRTQRVSRSRARAGVEFEALATWSRRRGSRWRDRDASAVVSAWRRESLRSSAHPFGSPRDAGTRSRERHKPGKRWRPIANRIARA